MDFIGICEVCLWCVFCLELQNTESTLVHVELAETKENTDQVCIIILDTFKLALQWLAIKLAISISTIRKLAVVFLSFQI